MRSGSCILSGALSFDKILLLVLLLCLFFLVSCSEDISRNEEYDLVAQPEEAKSPPSNLEEMTKSPSTIEEKNKSLSTQEEGTKSSPILEEKPPIEQQKKQLPVKEFRLEIPTSEERQSLPSCEGVFFTTFPVDMDIVREISPIGNLGPPGHTFPTDHPHLHVGEYDSQQAFDIQAPADVYLTTISWGEGMTQDPRDYTIYFALCQDIIAYYNHVKTLSPELQKIVDNYPCESFSSPKGCTKVLPLTRFENGKVMGTVGHKQGNWDFGLIDLRVNLGFIKPERHPQRTRHIQCPFDYYPLDMKKQFYDLIKRDDGTCGGIMQDVMGTLQGVWFHTTAPTTEVVDWNSYLAFVHDSVLTSVEVVSIAGKFTTPSLYPFYPKDSGKANRQFSQVTPDGNIYCYQAEKIDGRYSSIPSGKIIVQLTNNETVLIEHQEGSCTGNEELVKPEVYKR